MEFSRTGRLPRVSGLRYSSGVNTTRRAVLQTAATLSIVPRHVLGGAGNKAANEKLNVAAVGVGGMGANYVAGCASENIVALCDVDESLAAKTFRKYPAARTWRDYRRMLDAEKNIDAVIIGTPDHAHAEIALAAMQLGKHVYCAKPLTRTISECRAVAEAARRAKVATQMSVQSCASDESLNTVEWVRSGAIGSVSEVHVWSDRPVWPQAILRPTDTPPVPPSLDWKQWLAHAPERPYHPLYHPFNWRGWVDFGTGALGDMACHSFHVIVQALRLGSPTAVSASSAFLMAPAYANDADQTWTRSRKLRHPETWPASSVVTWEYPGVRVIWYDGGLKPPRPVDLPSGRQLGNDGILFVGNKGVLLSGFTGRPQLLPESRQASFDPPPKTLARSSGHYTEWIEAAKGGKPAKCEFGFGSQLAEMALLGCLAVRSGQYLTWDAAAGRTNSAEANALI